MAKYVIPPKMIPPNTLIVKCKECGALYVPDRQKDDRLNGDFDAFEKCPICSCRHNRYAQRIQLWKYNLIKLFRGGFRGDS